MSCKVQLDEDVYRLVSPNGIEGEPVEYGDEPALVAEGDRLYYCQIAEAPDEGSYDGINVFAGALQVLQDVAPVVAEDDGPDMCVVLTMRCTSPRPTDFEVEEVGGLDDDGGDDDGLPLTGEDDEEEEEEYDDQAVA